MYYDDEELEQEHYEMTHTLDFFIESDAKCVVCGVQNSGERPIHLCCSECGGPMHAECGADTEPSGGWDNNPEVNYWVCNTCLEQFSVLNAVAQYAHDRHSRLTKASVFGFSQEDLDRVLTDDRGYLVFSVQNLHVTEKRQEDDTIMWYVSATQFFHATDYGERIEGSTDTYQCYRDGDEWLIEWYGE